MIRAAALCALVLAATPAEARHHRYAYDWHGYHHGKHHQLRSNWHDDIRPVSARRMDDTVDRCTVVQAVPVTFSALPWWRTSLMTPPSKFELLR
jgi:hypothetical protein